MAWKSAPPAAAPHLPFHLGSCRSMIDFGSSASLILDGLYTSTVDRAAMPTHSCVEGAYVGPTCAMVLSSIFARRPAFCTVVIAGEFSVRKTSAGDLSPSWTICAPIEESLP